MSKQMIPMTFIQGQEVSSEVREGFIEEFMKYSTEARGDLYVCFYDVDIMQKILDQTKKDLKV